MALHIERSADRRLAPEADRRARPAVADEREPPSRDGGLPGPVEQVEAGARLPGSREARIVFGIPDLEVDDRARALPPEQVEALLDPARVGLKRGAERIRGVAERPDLGRPERMTAGGDDASRPL